MRKSNVWTRWVIFTYLFLAFSQWGSTDGRTANTRILLSYACQNHSRNSADFREYSLIAAYRY
jgi:hypothetical protein